MELTGHGMLLLEAGDADAVVEVLAAARIRVFYPLHRIEVEDDEQSDWSVLRSYELVCVLWM